LTGSVDISTKNPSQFNEIQRVVCRADGGSFTLWFRGATSGDIPFNAKAYDVQKYIEALPTIGSGATKVIFSGSPQVNPLLK
jgi:hypothetical protein